MSGPGRLVVIGDALLDVDLLGTATRLSPDAPVPVVEDIVEHARPGGAALAAYLAARDGREVVLLAPFADDAGAARLRELLAPHLQVVGLGWAGSTPVKTRVRVAGQSLLRLDTGGAGGAVGPLPRSVGPLLDGAGGLLVADYGRGATSAESVRAALSALPARVPVVWDPHPRGSAPVAGVRLATPNRAEAEIFAPNASGEDGLAGVSARARELVHAWGANAVAVTLGARGALLSFGGEGAPLVVPAPPLGSAADPCGAGDCFSATAAGLLTDGALPSEAVQGAVLAASAFVANGGASAVSVTGPGPGAGDRQIARTGEGGGRAADRPGSSAVAARRSAGRTVVATGGCFDLLHAGHVATLRAARALGDCLVVCLNSDASVRRLKGAQRPLQSELDRMQVLLALECVDEVLIFDDDTPERVLSGVRPDVWVKGGDYAGVELPESRLLASWGGQVVVLPYLRGRSTSLLVRAAGGAADGQAVAVPSLSEEFE